MTTTEIFLGVIAVSVLAMAIGQVVTALMAMRAARRVTDTLGRVEESIRPIVTDVQHIVTNVHRMSNDASRATSIAIAQVQRAEQIMDTVTQRVDETLTAVQDTLLAPARNSRAVFQGVRAALSAFFEAPARARGRRAQGPSRAAAEDDASFIG